MGLFRRSTSPATGQLPASTAPAPIDLTSAIESLFVKAAEAQAKLFESLTRMNAEMLQQAIGVQQKAQKRIGGMLRARTAKRAANGRMVQCRLCSNPAIADPTADEIMAHTSHRGGPRPGPDDPPREPEPEFPYAVRNGAVHVDVPESAVQTDAQGNEVIECASCAKGIHHTH